MTYESRTYDNEHGDPVVVLVVTGTHDVSRFTNWMNGRVPTIEIYQAGEKILRQLRRNNTGRAALKLLREHGGTDFLDTAQARAEERVLKAHDDELREYIAQERGRDLAQGSEVAS